MTTTSDAAATHADRTRRRLAVIASVLALAVALDYAPVAWGSMFGEENLTLVQILTEMTHAKQELEDINDIAHVSAETMRDLKETYARVNAGISELEGYSWSHFESDFTKDLYATYPGIGELAGASKNLRHWDDTRTQSPFTSYQAITAVAGDVSDALKRDARDGHTNLDEELIRHKEAAEELAQAQLAVDAANRFDADTKDLLAETIDASPGKAAQISARAQVILAAQQSHIMRLLARAVRHDGVDLALAYAARIRARNAGAARAHGKDTWSVFDAAAARPRLMDFSAESSGDATTDHGGF